MRMFPLVCTGDTQGHIDYGKPVHAFQSTDYRTFQKHSHHFVPPIPQEFDCRVKTKIKKELLDKDVALRDNIGSSYNKNFENIFTQEVEKFRNPNLCTKVDYIQTLHEKLTKNLEGPIVPRISEMKDSYRLLYHKSRSSDYDIFPPAFTSICGVMDTGRSVQPSMHPGEKGSWKHLDIYMTEKNFKHSPFNLQQLEIAIEHPTTFHNGNGSYKPYKKKLPEPSVGNKVIYDKRTFKFMFPHKFLSSAPRRVPNSGMLSEYGERYASITSSDLYPYIGDSGVEFKESLSGSGPWQNLCAPAMYCTESCHIGSSAFPIRAVVDVGNPIPEKKYVIHKPCHVTVE